MRRAVIALVVVLGLVRFASAAPPEDFKAYCAGKWADSFQMQAYCVKQETEARAAVGQWASTDSAIYARCWRKWDSWQMVQYCGTQERKARNALAGTPEPAAPAPSVPQLPAAPPPSTPATAGVNVTPDRDAIEACSMLFKAVDRFLVYNSIAGLRRDLREVVQRAYGSPDAYVKNAANILSAAINSEGVGDAAHTFATTCARRVVPRAQSDLANKQSEIEEAARRAREATAPPLPAKLPRPISEREADQQVQGVLERSGVTDAKCTKRQFGTGWVTVCD
jgi:hypothetical protein